MVEVCDFLAPVFHCSSPCPAHHCIGCGSVEGVKDHAVRQPVSHLSGRLNLHRSQRVAILTQNQLAKCSSEYELILQCVFVGSLISKQPMHAMGKRNEDSLLQSCILSFGPRSLCSLACITVSHSLADSYIHCVYGSMFMHTDAIVSHKRYGEVERRQVSNAYIA